MKKFLLFHLEKFLLSPRILHATVRLLIILGSIARYLINPKIEPYSSFWLPCIVFYTIYTIIIITRDRPSWNRAQIIIDTFFVATFFLLTNSLNSEYHLFFFLPVVLAADYCKYDEQVNYFILISVVYSLSVICAAKLDPFYYYTLSESVIRSLIPRLVAFLFIIFVVLMKSKGIKEKNAIITVASETASRVAWEVDLQGRLEAILHSAVSLLKAKGAKIYLHEPVTNRLELVALSGVKNDALNIGHTISTDEGLAGNVFKTQKTLSLLDYSTYLNRIPAFTNIFGAIIENPFIIRGDSIGVIGVFDKKNRIFSDDDISSLQILAQHATSAIHDIRSSEFLNEQKDSLNDLLIASIDLNSTLDIEGIYSHLAKHTWELSNRYAKAKSLFSCVAVIIDGSLRTAATYPVDMKQIIEQIVGKIILTDSKPIGLIGRAIVNNEALIENNVKGNGDYICVDPGTNSQVVVPLVGSNGIFGVISVEHANLNAYPEQTKYFLTILANQASSAIGKAEFYKKQENLSVKTDLLYHAITSISFSEGKENTAHSLANALFKIIPFDILIMETIENQAKETIYYQNNTQKVVDIKTLLFDVEEDEEEIIRQKKGDYIIPSKENNFQREYYILNDFNTIYSFPLILADSVVGIVHLIFQIAFNISDETKKILDVFSSQAASLLRNAILYEESQSRIEELSQTKENYEIALDYMNEHHILASIGLVYGEDIHYAKSRLGIAKTIARKIIMSEFGIVPDIIEDAAQNIIDEMDKYFKTLQDTQKKYIGPLEPIKFNLHDLMEDTLRSKNMLLTRNKINVVPSYHLRDPIITAPNKQLQQVFFVIIQNAIDAMQKKGGGKLSIWTDDRFTVAGKPYIKVIFKDTGGGIPEEAQKHLFEWKFQSISSRKGSGMGLMWAQSFLKTYRGKISYTVEKNIGTSMELAFPRDFGQPLFYRTSED